MEKGGNTIILLESAQSMYVVMCDLIDLGIKLLRNDDLVYLFYVSFNHVVNSGVARTHS